MSNTHTVHEAGDIDLIAMWLKIDPKRWIAGVLGGITAGWIAMVVAMIFAVIGGNELLYPVKVVATTALGSGAVEMGMQMGNIIVGAVLFTLVCTILGVAYAHFSVTNHPGALFGAGFVWGTFSWIFIFCLYTQSFKGFNALGLGRGSALILNLIWGFSLSITGFFDKILRK